MPSRRRFLQVGLAGAAVLAIAGLVARPRRDGTFRAIASDDAPVIAAIAAVVLEGALPAPPRREAALREVVEAFDRAVSGLAPAVRDEIGELLGLLRFAPGRIAFTGIRQPLAEASPDEVAAFLSRWRASRFDLLRAGCQALTQLVNAAWYGNPASWPAIGYPGPPALAPGRPLP